MFDKLINRIGVSLALILMICELTYVNAKSLLFMAGSSNSIDEIMSWVGALAYSMVTVVVMRKTERGWFKLVFPVFDAALVFLGFNLHYAESIISGGDNPVRLYLSVFLAVFTGVITYSLGLINYRDHATDIVVVKTDIDNGQGESEAAVSELLHQKESLELTLRKQEGQIGDYASECEVLRSDIAALQTEMENREGDHQAVKHHLTSTQKELIKYRSAYLSSECSRIRKKKPENRTTDEMAILQMMETN